MLEHDATANGVSTTPIHALDASYYTDPSAFERDKQRILLRTWHYAGHVSQVEKPGDYFAFSICDRGSEPPQGAPSYGIRCIHALRRSAPWTRIVCPASSPPSSTPTWPTTAG